ncbi:MAG: hypothetical protein Ct9H300mP13_3970 [Gammaproteobacteria bacterium]|nr:MAG: hypothetical protein Ct9H300mP13_3970 [Gammaproteobacteria bacterium]
MFSRDVFRVIGATCLSLSIPLHLFQCYRQDITHDNGQVHCTLLPRVRISWAYLNDLIACRCRGYLFSFFDRANYYRRHGMKTLYQRTLAHSVGMGLLRWNVLNARLLFWGTAN